MHPSLVVFRIAALTLLMENVSNGEGGGLSHSERLASTSQLGSPARPQQARLSRLRVPAEAKAKSSREWQASLDETFPMLASVTADCCQWEETVIGPLL